MARPRKYASDAEKMRAYRERYSVVTLRFEHETMATINRLADEFEASQSDVVNSLVKFALTNRNWFTMGLYGKRLPVAENPIEGEIDD
jgi:hypothetical protein